MNKKVTTFISSILLATGTIAVVNTVKPAQQVQAVSKHSYRWHWVHTTKKKDIIRVNSHRAFAYWRPLEIVELPKRYSFKIRYCGGNANYFQLKSLGAGMGGYWIVWGRNANWFKNGYVNPPY